MPKSRGRKTKKNKPTRRRAEPACKPELLLTLYSTGLRACEALQLKWDDIDLDAGTINAEVVQSVGKTFEALDHLKELRAMQHAMVGHHQQPMHEATRQDEEQQVWRIGQLLRPGQWWACDWPYHESGVNSEGGQSYTLVTSDQPRVVVARADDWDGLFAAASHAAAAGAPWARPLGARQQVYDHAYAWRLKVGAEPMDAHDLALGAADFPFIGLDYFLGWLRANPQELADNVAAQALVKANKTEGIDMQPLLAYALARPMPKPEPVS